MANAAPQLQEAYDLIETGDLQSARQVLADIETDNTNNPDFWWIYAHAVEDQAEGIAALERVHQLAPNYPGLSMLSEKLGIHHTTPTSVADAPSTEDIDEFYERSTPPKVAKTTDGRSANSRLPVILFGTIAVVAIIAGLFYVASLFSNNDLESTPTAIIAATDIPVVPIIPTADSESEIATQEEPLTTEDAVVTEDTLTPTDEPTEQLPTPTSEPTATNAPTDIPEDTDPFASVYANLAPFGVEEDSITVETTENFGETYLIPTCSSLGPVATRNILNIIDALEDIDANLDQEVTGFAFTITDCETNTSNLVLGIDRATVEQYWADEIAQSAVQQSLQRIIIN